MTWIQTYTGRQFWPLNPRREDVGIRDIAHALSLTCRFNGHCRQFYSVAEHSVRVLHAVQLELDASSMNFSDVLMLQRWALLHDAAEAYVGDMVRPLTRQALFTPGEGHDIWAITFTEAEIQVQVAIIKALCGPLTPDDRGRVAEVEGLVKHADCKLLATEARDLMGRPPAEWEHLPAPLDLRIEPWPAEEAERRFLAWVNTLGVMVIRVERQPHGATS